MIMLSRFWSPGEVYGKWIVSFAGFMCVLTCGQSTSWLTPALSKIFNDEAGFTLSSADIDNIVAFTAVGFFIGPFLGGLTMDRIGRRNTLLFWATVYLASGIAVIFITDAVSIFIARFLIGTWAGIAATVTPLILGEFLNSAQRDEMFSYYTACFVSGFVLESLSGFGNYFIVSVVSVGTSVPLILSLLIIPESHYYYLMKNEKSKAKETIIWLKGSCNDQEIDELEKIVHEQMLQKSTFIELVTNKPTRRALYTVVFIAILQKFVAHMLFSSYFFQFFPESLLPNNINFLIYSISLFVGAFCPKLILYRIGGVLTLRYSLLLATFSILTFSVWFFLRDSTSINVAGTEWILYICLVTVGFSVSSIATVQAKYQGELFPVNFKAIGTAVSVGMGSLTSILVAGTFSRMVSFIGLYSNFAVEAIVSFLGIVFTFWMIETKGKTLEKIQEDL